MKTREIEVYANAAGLEVMFKHKTGFLEVNTVNMKGDVKVKIVFEAPEKKIEITESEFDEAWFKSAAAETHSVHQSYLNLKEKLFSKGADDEHLP